MPSGDHVIRVKITLLGIKPPIWRRIELLDDASFWTLHVAIQDAMGWHDCHLHEFTEFGDMADEDALRIGLPVEPMDDFGGPETAPGWLVPMCSALTLSERRLKYAYDFGDGWMHEVRLEQIRPLARDESRDDFPRCTGGRRACPPEDIGGVGMYTELVQQLADRPAAGAAGRVTNEDDKDDEDDIAADFPGFDPEAFDPAAVRFDDSGVRLARLLHSM